MTSISAFAQMPPLETGVSHELAKWRAANYSDVRYKLNITLEKAAPLMTGDIEIRVNLTDEGAKNDLILDWRTTQFANDKDKPFANVVTVNNAVGAQSSLLASEAQKRENTSETTNAVSPSADGGASRMLALPSKEHLIIPKKFLKTGENVIKINFASPIKTSGAAVTRYVDKEDNAEYVYSLFVPSDASTAFPVFDQPDLKAKFQLWLETPNTWKAVSNTQYSVASSREIKDKDTKQTFMFFETKPISTYVFAFAAGDFAEFDGRGDGLSSPAASNNANASGRGQAPPLPSEIKIYVRKSQADKLKNAKVGSAGIPACDKRESANNQVETKDASESKRNASQATLAGRDACAPVEEIFRLNREAIKFLEDWFDYKFPFPKYDLVLIPEFPFGGMEHAGATFLREDRVIFPTEPTKNDYITRANVIFHEAAHQWFGDTVTMKWFDDLWLKEGFAEFMAYKTLEKVLPEYNAWKVFYERNKQAAYLTDVTRGTTPIYQEIPNLSSAKSAYGNIVYRKAPSFLRQAEFYLGEKEFQTAVRAFLKKHEFANATWQDLVKEFETATADNLQDWANSWVTKRGMPKFTIKHHIAKKQLSLIDVMQQGLIEGDVIRSESFKILLCRNDNKREVVNLWTYTSHQLLQIKRGDNYTLPRNLVFIFPNYQDYGYGIFLLDEKSRRYVLENIQNEKDDFLRSMMWGSLWDAVRFYELAPEDYVKLVIKNINTETDESTIATLLNRVSTVMNYYIPESGNPRVSKGADTKFGTLPDGRVSASESKLAPEIEKLLIEKISNAPTLGQRITFYRSLVALASTENARNVLKDVLSGKFCIEGLNCRGDGLSSPAASNAANANGQGQAQPLQSLLKPKDKFDIVTKLIALGDADGLKLLAELEKQYTDDAAKRYAYAARAGIPTAENKLKYWKDFTENKDLSESYIESAFAVWNTPRHSDLTLPYLEKALAELPNLKRTRKIFFVNNWLGAFIGGQKSAEALKIVNDFLDENPDLDKDLRLKILENADNLERAVKIRKMFAERAKLRH